MSVTGAVCTGTTAGDDSASITGAQVTSQGTITANLVLAPAVTTDTAALCGLSVQNPAVIAGGNDALYILAGAIGLGEASTVAPVVTASNSGTVALNAGAASTSVTLTGTGFSSYSTPTAETAGVNFGAPTGNTGTTLTFPVTVVAAGATTGAIAGEVVNNAAASNVLIPAATVAGPAITSASPAALAVNAPFGTTLAITGTGFTNTITTTTIGRAGTASLAVLTYVSATSLYFVVTTSPNAGTELRRHSKMTSSR